MIRPFIPWHQQHFHFIIRSIRKDIVLRTFLQQPKNFCLHKSGCAGGALGIILDSLTSLPLPGPMEL